MDGLRNLNWPLALGLGALALVRPLVRIVTDQLGPPEPPAVAIGTTVAISVVWVVVVGFSRVRRPVLTLVAAGLVYAVLSIVLSGVLSPLLTGRLQGPLAMPIAIVPVLLTNLVWGAGTGALALLVQRARGVRAERSGDPRR
ncbi:MAG TPA: hypothetical protein VEZ42_06640 [Pseudonocardia sp.]|nr:hypothetical protein [Pseudonocardia sp.]